MRFQTVSPRQGKVISELRGSGLGLGFFLESGVLSLGFVDPYSKSARNLSMETRFTVLCRRAS